jgi:hypothetical protein
MIAPTFVAPTLAAGRWAFALLVAWVHDPHAAWPVLLLFPFAYHAFRALIRLQSYIEKRVAREPLGGGS